MTKYSGRIGLRRLIPEETSPGVIGFPIEEKEVTGDFINGSMRWQPAGQGDSANLGQVLSIFMPEDNNTEHREVVYIEYQGRKWTVVGIKYVYPRVHLTVGGPYNG